MSAGDVRVSGDDAPEFHVVRVIGRGSFGTATLVRNAVDRKLYVHKKVSFAEARGERERIKMHEEARKEGSIMKRLVHPNVVAVYACYSSCT